MISNRIEVKSNVLYVNFGKVFVNEELYRLLIFLRQYKAPVELK